MTCYPSQSHYPGNEPTSLCPILLMPSARLGGRQVSILNHWFDSTMVQNSKVHIRICDLQIPNLPERKAHSTHSTTLTGLCPPGEVAELGGGQVQYRAGICLMSKSCMFMSLWVCILQAENHTPSSARSYSLSGTVKSHNWQQHVFGIYFMVPKHLWLHSILLLCVLFSIAFCIRKLVTIQE